MSISWQLVRFFIANNSIAQLSNSARRKARKAIARTATMEHETAVSIGNRVMRILQHDFGGQNRICIAYDNAKEADSLFFACARSNPNAAVVAISSDADIRGMQQEPEFSLIVSLQNGIPGHIWQGRSIWDALHCEPLVLQVVYALYGDNASHKLTGVRD